MVAPFIQRDTHGRQYNKIITASEAPIRIESLPQGHTLTLSMFPTSGEYRWDCTTDTDEDVQANIAAGTLENIEWFPWSKGSVTSATEKKDCIDVIMSSVTYIRPVAVSEGSAKAGALM